MISFVMGMSLFRSDFWPSHSHAHALAVTVLSHFNLFEQMHDFARRRVGTRSGDFLRQPDVSLPVPDLRVVESRAEIKCDRPQIPTSFFARPAGGRSASMSWRTALVLAVCDGELYRRAFLQAVLSEFADTRHLVRTHVSGCVR